MTTKDKELSADELTDLVRLIGKPTLEFMLKRIQNKILLDKKHSNMTMSTFISLMIGALATIDASALKWLSDAPLKRTGESINIDNLRAALILNINDQLGVTIN